MKTQYESTCFKLIGKYSINTGRSIVEKSAVEINEYFKNKKITVESIEQQMMKNGSVVSTTKKQTKNFYQVWSEDPDMKEYLEVIFECDKSKVLKTQYNIFKGFTHFDQQETKKVDLSGIFEHIRSLVDFNEQQFDYVLNWFAQLIQTPHILPHTCLVFISEEGVGKDIFSQFISSVINEEYTMNTEKLDNICGKFNSAIGGKLLITINETNPVESRERIENIKYIITADKVVIEGKYKDAVKASNFCRFMFFSNRLFAFPVDGNGSRRPNIMKSSSKYLSSNIGIEENKKFFDNMAHMYQSKDYQKEFLLFLRARDISKWNPKDICKSELHKELEENSISPIVHYLSGIVRNAGDVKSIRILTKECLGEYNIFAHENGYKYDLSPTKFSVELVSTYKVKRIKTGGYEYFQFNIAELKLLLSTKYKVVFDNTDDIVEEDIEDLTQQNQLAIELEEMKKKYAELEAKYKELTQPIIQVKKPKTKSKSNPELKRLTEKQEKELIDCDEDNEITDEDYSKLASFF